MSVEAHLRQVPCKQAYERLTHVLRYAVHKVQRRQLVLGWTLLPAHVCQQLALSTR